MKPWTQRPIEIRNLFNPAFCGLLLQRAIGGFEKVEPKGMQYSLSLLILPLILHRETREKMSAQPRTSILSIFEKHPELLLDFDERARGLLPFTQEAFGFLAQNHCLDVSLDGRLLTVTRRIRTKDIGTPESIECQKVARRVGKEFARIGDRATIYTTLGVRP